MCFKQQHQCHPAMVSSSCTYCMSKHAYIFCRRPCRLNESGAGSCPRTCNYITTFFLVKLALFPLAFLLLCAMECQLGCVYACMHVWLTSLLVFCWCFFPLFVFMIGSFSYSCIEVPLMETDSPVHEVSSSCNNISISELMICLRVRGERAAERSEVASVP